MNKLISLSLLTVVFAACQNTGERKTTTTAPSSPTTLSIPTATAGTRNDSATTLNSATATALNPEHGAPGHRCELPVGAPLNSSPNTAPVTNNNIAPVTIQPQFPAKPANGNARVNPAHGAPGHDCNVPVGSPL